MNIGIILRKHYILDLMKRSEHTLILIAERSLDDKAANEAMKELRERFDKTYFWCEDCDGLVTTEKDCCLNNLSELLPNGVKVNF